MHFICARWSEIILTAPTIFSHNILVAFKKDGGLYRESINTITVHHYIPLSSGACADGQ